jgi:hypothetical protein
MLKRLQLVLVGVVVLQAAGMNASEKQSQISPKTPRTPRTSLSCSQEARSNSGDFAVVTGLKRSLDQRKEGPNNTIHVYYPWPGANPDYSIVDQMKPWSPHHFYDI